MNRIKSKFSIIQVFIVPLFILAFFYGLSTFMLYTGLSENHKGSIFFLSFGSAIGILGIYTFYYYLTFFKVITMDQHQIRFTGLFTSKDYDWSEISKIRLTGKESEKFLFVGMPMEAISVEFKDAHKEVFFVKYYSNMAKIRVVLRMIRNQLGKQRKVDLRELQTHTQKKKIHIRNYFSFTKFSGNHLFTFNGLIIYGWGVFAIFVIGFANSPSPTYIVATVLGIVFMVFYGLSGYQLHYFMMDSNYLVVKNHVWFWRTHKYLVSDIQQVVFETPHKMSTSLRIITKNYETKLYPGGSLRNNTWKAFMKAFNDNNIKIRNETLY